MGLFDWIKNTAGSIWNGIKQGAQGVMDVGGKIRDGISSGYNFIKNIPIVGNLVDQGLDKLKIGGIGVKDIAGMASDALDVGQQINGYINPKAPVSAADEQISRISAAPPAPAKATVPKQLQMPFTGKVATSKKGRRQRT